MLDSNSKFSENFCLPNKEDQKGKVRLTWVVWHRMGVFQKKLHFFHSGSLLGTMRNVTMGR